MVCLLSKSKHITTQTEKADWQSLICIVIIILSPEYDSYEKIRVVACTYTAGITHHLENLENDINASFMTLNDSRHDLHFAGTNLHSPV